MVKRFHTAKGCSPENEKMAMFRLHQLRDECICVPKVALLLGKTV